jgi:hypothetical protein
MDTFLNPYLTDTTQWSTSPSLILQGVTKAFSNITSLPTFTPDPTDPNPIYRSIPTLLTAPDGSYSLGLLFHIAGRHAQHAFSRAVFGAFRANLYAHPFPLLTLARLRHSAAPLAHTPFTAYYLPD